MPAESRPAPTADLLPHDLLEIASPGALRSVAPRPAWVDRSLERAPFVVVRRARPHGALVPIGVRGARRGERFAAWLPASGALRRIRPEDLAAERGWRTRGVPLLSALSVVEELLEAHALAWGPVGSAGFELASGVACVTPASDLDVVARAPEPFAPDGARRLHAVLAALPVRIDLQLETPAGGVALAEYAAGSSRVVLRTLEGPRWATTPWPAGTAP